jgi:hypothetical protein
MSNTPADIANQALDAIGYPTAIGDLQEGTRPAQVILRAYGQCLRQLIRAAHWDFCRKTAPLTLLADATRQTPNVGTIVPVPWIYEYAYATDCAKARFIPWNQGANNPGAPTGNIVPANYTAPIVASLGQQPLTGQRITPARFTIATDPNYPPQPGQITWEVQGLSPQGRTVVLTNVANAQMVYSAIMLYPSLWDALFRGAFVAYLASEVALPLSKDKKFGLQLRSEQIKIAQMKIQQARVTDGNEGWFSSSLSVDWMRFRNAGGGYGAWGEGGSTGGPGVLGYGWDQCSFGDGSAY